MTPVLRSNRLVKPKTKEELRRAIKKEMTRVGPCCELNFIDVSSITDFSELFLNSPFNGDISQWDVSNATTMHRMFESSLFNRDLSEWNVVRVTDMKQMFGLSQFNGDISKWNVAGVRDFKQMFYNGQFKGDLSAWPIHSEANMGTMFSFAQTQVDDKASVFHWRLADINTNNVSPRLRAFYEEHAPLIRSIVSDPVERAYWLHDQWRREMTQGSRPQETYTVDAGVFTTESNT